MKSQDTTQSFPSAGVPSAGAGRNPDPERGDPLGAAVVSAPRLRHMDLFCGLCEGAGLSPVGSILQHD